MERRECLRWAGAREETAGVSVFYGADTIYTPGTVLSGGGVKLLDLQEVFPNVPDKPTLLYLISSALPPYAARIVWWAKKRGAKIVLNQNGVAYPAWHGPGWEKANTVPRTVLRAADYVF